MVVKMLTILTASPLLILIFIGLTTPTSAAADVQYAGEIKLLNATSSGYRNPFFQIVEKNNRVYSVVKQAPTVQVKAYMTIDFQVFPSNIPLKDWEDEAAAGSLDSTKTSSLKYFLKRMVIPRPEFLDKKGVYLISPKARTRIEQTKAEPRDFQVRMELRDQNRKEFPEIYITIFFDVKLTRASNTPEANVADDKNEPYTCQITLLNVTESNNKHLGLKRYNNYVYVENKQPLVEQRKQSLVTTYKVFPVPTAPYKLGRQRWNRPLAKPTEPSGNFALTRALTQMFIPSLDFWNKPQEGYAIPLLVTGKFSMPSTIYKEFVVKVTMITPITEKNPSITMFAKVTLNEKLANNQPIIPKDFALYSGEVQIIDASVDSVNNYIDIKKNGQRLSSVIKKELNENRKDSLNASFIVSPVIDVGPEVRSAGLIPALKNNLEVQKGNEKVIRKDQFMSNTAAMLIPEVEFLDKKGDNVVVRNVIGLFILPKNMPNSTNMTVHIRDGNRVEEPLITMRVTVYLFPTNTPIDPLWGSDNEEYRGDVTMNEVTCSKNPYFEIKDVRFNEDMDPIWSLEVVQPLSEEKKKNLIITVSTEIVKDKLPVPEIPSEKVQNALAKSAQPSGYFSLPRTLIQTLFPSLDFLDEKGEHVIPYKVLSMLILPEKIASQFRVQFLLNGIGGNDKPLITASYLVKLNPATIVNA